jgi:hypothetical protein
MAIWWLGKPQEWMVTVQSTEMKASLAVFAIKGTKTAKNI